jgi:hypothetical protein
MTATPITSAAVGTAVIAAAGSFKGLVVTMPIAANADAHTPLTLIDATAASGVGPLLYSACLSDLEAILFGFNQTSVPAVPGSPTAQPAGTLFINGAIPFAKGLYVKSCPANMTFTATT